MNLPCSPGMCRSRSLVAFFPALAFLLLLPVVSPGQEPGTVVIDAPPQAVEGAPLLLTAELLYGDAVDAAYILYRAPGTGEYLRREMDLRGSRAGVQIPATDVQPPFFEYYLVFRSRTGALTTHPFHASADPFREAPPNPLRIPVRPAASTGADVLFLSPEPGSTVAADELVISVSLLRADSLVDLGATRLLLDGVDVTADALLAGDLLVYVPSNVDRPLAPGRHQASVRLVALDGSPYGTYAFPFTVSGEGVPEDDTGAGVFRTRVSLQHETRREVVSGGDTWYNRALVQFHGTSGIWSVRSNAFVTSEERSDRQPQNRYFIGASIPWLSAGFGDAYPAFSNLVLSGRRVRGLHSSLTLGEFRVDMALGQTERPLEGRLLREIPIDSLGAAQAADPAGAYAPLSGTTWGKFRYGTYERKLFAVRPSIGGGRTWRLGFTWLKAKDDEASIRWGNRPQENLVLGGDAVIRPFGETLELFGEAAFSAFNANISGGNFTDAHIDSVYPNDASSIKRVRDILDDFITVNDNLRPLSLKVLSTAAYEVGAGLNALGQNLRVSYLFRGDQYTSFGQAFLRKDVRGFSAVDRVRLLDNQVFVSVGLERVKDNIGGSKSSTTTFTTFDASVSYYPLQELPSLTVGFGHIANRNTLALSAADAVDERGNRFFAQTSYGFTTHARHTVSAGFSVSRRDDRTARALDVNDRSASVGITTVFPIPLQIAADFTHSRSERPGMTAGEVFGYSTLGFSLRYGVIPDLVTLRGTASPTYGDIQRMLVGAGVDVALASAMNLTLEYSQFQQASGFKDSIGTLRYRYDL